MTTEQTMDKKLEEYEKNKVKVESKLGRKIYQSLLGLNMGSGWSYFDLTAHIYNLIQESLQQQRDQLIGEVEKLPAYSRIDFYKLKEYVLKEDLLTLLKQDNKPTKKG